VAFTTGVGYCPTCDMVFLLIISGVVSLPEILYVEEISGMSANG